MGAELSRREFAIVAGVAAVSLAAPGLSGCAPATDAKAAAVETPTYTFGGDTMSQRVLVAYATRTGSTTGVAEAIGKVLGERGFAVDVKPMRERPSVAGYDAVVLGSAINGAAWLPEAMTYLQANSSALAKVPTAAFCVHSMNGGADAKQTKRRLAYLKAVRALVTPCDEGYFLGAGPDPEDTSLIARWAFKAFGGSGEGDMRDWDAIDAWAQQLRV